MDIHELVKLVKKLHRESGQVPKYNDLQEFVSRRTIDKFTLNKILDAAGLEPTKQTDPVELEKKAPRILALDIETSPILAHVWGLWENNVSLNMIERDWFVLSYCAKFVGEDKVYYADQRNEKDIENDLKLMVGIRDLIEKADILLTHNGDKFDIKKLNARFILHKLQPVPPKQSIDTLKIAKRFFSFTSNKLEYIAKYLGCKEKSKHGEFPGFSMWSECLKGNKKAFKEMQLYNLQDVETLIEVYDKLKSWDTNLNFQAFYGKLVCVCGESLFFKNGMRYTKSSINQLYKCSGCNKSYTDKTNLIKKENKIGFAK